MGKAGKVTLWVRSVRDGGFIRCGLQFSRVWSDVTVEPDVAERLAGERLLEVSESRPLLVAQEAHREAMAELNARKAQLASTNPDHPKLKARQQAVKDADRFLADVIAENELDAEHRQQVELGDDGEAAAQAAAAAAAEAKAAAAEKAEAEAAKAAAEAKVAEEAAAAEKAAKAAKNQGKAQK